MLQYETHCAALRALPVGARPVAALSDRLT